MYVYTQLCVSPAPLVPGRATVLPSLQKPQLDHNVISSVCSFTFQARCSEDQGWRVKNRERYSLYNSYVDAYSSENSREQDIVGPLAVCLQPCQVLWSRRFHHFRHLLFRKEIAKILDGLVDDILGNINVQLTWSWSWGRRHGFVEGRRTLTVPATKVQGIYSLLNIFLSAICFWLISIFVIPLCSSFLSCS